MINVPGGRLVVEVRYTSDQEACGDGGRTRIVTFGCWRRVNGIRRAAASATRMSVIKPDIEALALGVFSFDRRAGHNR